MNILITGASGFLGARLARTLLAQGKLAGQSIDSLLLADLSPSPADLAADPRVRSHTGDLFALTKRLQEEQIDGVFHLASAVSAECEANFELGMRSNLDSTRALLDTLHQAGNTPRLVFASSVAVFGNDPLLTLPDCIDDRTLPTPQSSYGIQKFICEQLVADYTRKGYVDGRVARLMTVAVRPGKPNGAASSFLSAIIREPLAGQSANCPVPLSTEVALASPANTIAGLIKVFEASREAFGGRTALNLPALTVSVQQMLDALGEIASPAARQLVTLQHDAAIANIVGNWPARFHSPRASALGLQADASFSDIIRQYQQEYLHT
ncbi:SDR family oxidoreductase [Neisseriaceae bacterium TC5R-5]|nr:SDR family oxidoreductase [Neisseriaceae bacterium TC5R-5]